MSSIVELSSSKLTSEYDVVGVADDDDEVFVGVVTAHEVYRHKEVVAVNSNSSDCPVQSDEDEDDEIFFGGAVSTREMDLVRELEEKSATCIQRSWQASTSRRRFAALRSSVATMQCRWRFRKVRAVANGRSAHRFVDVGAPDASALILQNACSKALILERSVSVLQARFRFRVRREKAVLLQAWWRMCSAKQRFSRIRNGVIAVQRIVRGVAARNAASTTIAKNWRRYSARDAYMRAQRSARILQKCVRSFLRRRKEEEETGISALDTAVEISMDDSQECNLHDEDQDEEVLLIGAEGTADSTLEKQLSHLSEEQVMSQEPQMHVQLEDGAEEGSDPATTVADACEVESQCAEDDEETAMENEAVEVSPVETSEAAATNEECTVPEANVETETAALPTAKPADDDNTDSTGASGTTVETSSTTESAEETMQSKLERKKRLLEQLREQRRKLEDKRKGVHDTLTQSTKMSERLSSILSNGSPAKPAASTGSSNKENDSKDEEATIPDAESKKSSAVSSDNKSVAVPSGKEKKRLVWADIADRADAVTDDMLEMKTTPFPEDLLYIFTDDDLHEPRHHELVHGSVRGVLRVKEAPVVIPSHMQARRVPSSSGATKSSSQHTSTSSVRSAVQILRERTQALAASQNSHHAGGKSAAPRSMLRMPSTFSKF